jgi:aryl-alcohol dehydrogenase-like predicted oxidoreductase
MQIDCRSGIRRAATVGGGSTVLPVAQTIVDSLEIGPMPMRILGRTQERVSLIGFGTAPLGSDVTTPDMADAALNFALEQGINYFDTAPVYGDPDQKYGNAECKLKNLVASHRKDIFLVTKVNAGQPDRDGVLRQLEASLKRMGAENVDAVHIHNLGDFDMEQVFAPNGALAGLKEAQDQGLLRFIGTSGHTRPWRFAAAIATGEIDLTMNAINFADDQTYDFRGAMLAEARKQNTALVAMKVLGGAAEWKYDGYADATLVDYYERAMRYALAIPDLACAVVGFKNVDEVRQAVAIAHDFTPLSEVEHAELVIKGRELAAARGLYYGPIDG